MSSPTSTHEVKNLVSPCRFTGRPVLYFRTNGCCLKGGPWMQGWEEAGLSPAQEPVKEGGTGLFLPHCSVPWPTRPTSTMRLAGRWPLSSPTSPSVTETRTGPPPPKALRRVPPQSPSSPCRTCPGICHPTCVRACVFHEGHSPWERPEVEPQQHLLTEGSS